MPPIDVSAGLIWYFIFLYSTVCHEAAHAWAALKLGDDTAYRGGQVSLDPIPHILREPLGMVVVPIVTFFLNAARGVTWMMGWASAPYDPEWASRNPRHAAWMALAGPAANLLLVIAAAICIRIGIAAGWFAAPERFAFSDIVRSVAPGGIAQAAASQRNSGYAKSDSWPLASTAATEMKKLSPAASPNSAGATALLVPVVMTRFR